MKNLRIIDCNNNYTYYNMDIYNENADYNISLKNAKCVEIHCGLVANNKRLIFEGDIIKYTVYPENIKIAHVPCLTAFAWFQELEEFIERGGIVEVIGNIHHNADLLGQIKMEIKPQDNIN